MRKLTAVFLTLILASVLVSCSEISKAENDMQAKTAETETAGTADTRKEKTGTVSSEKRGPDSAAKPIPWSIEDSPVWVLSDGERKQPYLELLWSEQWTENGWISADGEAVPDILPEISSQIPIVTYRDDFDLLYKDGVSFIFLSVYNELFQCIYSDAEPSILNGLAEGTYYIAIDVEEQINYNEYEGTYDKTAYSCIFKMIKTAA